IASAIGIVQLGRLDELQKTRNAVAGWYSDRLADIPGIVSMPPPERGVRLSWFTYVVRFDEPLLRLRAEQSLEAKGIPSRRYFEPIHLLPWCAERFGYRRGDFPHAERLADTLLALPFSSVMTEDAVDRV